MLLCTMKITNTILRSTRLVGWMGESVTLNDRLNYSPCRRQQIEPSALQFLIVDDTVHLHRSPYQHHGQLNEILIFAKFGEEIL